MKKIKRGLVIGCVISFLYVGLNTADASNVKTYLNGQKLDFDSPAVIKNGFTLVPVRNIVEAYDNRNKIDWDPVAKSVKITTRYQKEITLTVGLPYAKVDDIGVVIPKAPEIINGRVMVPLRSLSEMIGVEVDWDGKNRVINLYGNHHENAKETNSYFDNLFVASVKQGKLPDYDIKIGDPISKAALQLGQPEVIDYWAGANLYEYSDVSFHFDPFSSENILQITKYLVPQTRESIIEKLGQPNDEYLLYTDFWNHIIYIYGDFTIDFSGDSEKNNITEVSIYKNR
ncbi:hypothetical protein BEP19_16710 [Ammoniphilus oxalaticus]|uniref:Copper amine oxidase-like N-terminal domain-containing protein n=1 Tax=Ammoniphilus oxalaticus TaxID=66863 RepID=A0A419SQ27_9BACL|nr:copper amine oxidase N-terminal domain-containing protein [Ammoniphilus oxalaticus]RKD26479.1 hypothetical protein BEP19_16710 [Ammoniphilus oxalaticus]